MAIKTFDLFVIKNTEPMLKKKRQILRLNCFLSDNKKKNKLCTILFVRYGYFNFYFIRV